MRWTSARDVLDRIGGPYAVTLRGLLLITIPSLAPTVVFDRALNGGSMLTWALVGLAGTAVGGVVYLGLGRMLLPELRHAKLFKLHLARNLVHFMAQYLWTIGVVMLPLATASPK